MVRNVFQYVEKVCSVDETLQMVQLKDYTVIFDSTFIQNIESYLAIFIDFWLPAPPTVSHFLKILRLEAVKGDRVTR